MVKESLSFFVTKSIMFYLFQCGRTHPWAWPPWILRATTRPGSSCLSLPSARTLSLDTGLPTSAVWSARSVCLFSVKSLIFKTFSHPAYLHHINDNQSTLDAWLWRWLWSPSTPGYVQWRPPSPRAPSSPWWPAPDARHAALPWPRAPAPWPPGPRARLPSPRR